MIQITGMPEALEQLTLDTFRIAYPRLIVTLHAAYSSGERWRERSVTLRYPGSEDSGESVTWVQPYGDPGYWHGANYRGTDLVTALNQARLALLQRIA